MSDRPFLTVGTPGGLWPALFPSLLAGTGVDGAEMAADTLEQRAPQAQVLVLVERPALGLAAALAAGQVDDPAAWLQQWCDGARSLLWRVQSDPLRCLLVDAEEAWQNPEALAASVNQRFGLDVAAACAAVQLAAVDPLSRALAEAIAFADPDAQALFAELQASCALLSDEAPAANTLQAALQIDGLSANQALQALRQRVLTAEREMDRQPDVLAASHESAQAQHAAMQDMAAQLMQLNEAHQTQTKALQAALAAGAGADRQLADFSQENELLLLQLHQVQDELESVVLDHRETALRLADSIAERDAQDRHLFEQAQRLEHHEQLVHQLSAQLQQAQAHVSALHGEMRHHSERHDHMERALQGAQVALQASEQTSQQCAAAVAALQRQQATDQRTLADTRQENELMLQQLHQVQDELEHYGLECRRLQEAATAMVPASGNPDIAVGEVVPSAERDTPPHRELTFQLFRVAVQDRQIAEATVRLVEHQGHPGLVVFGNDTGPQLLSGWRETGREDGRPFMLLVPADAPARPLLAAMDQVDWLLLLSLPARLVQALDTLDPPIAPHWQRLAHRLQVQLLTQGRRFRYQQAQVAPVADGPPGAWAIEFNQVHWAHLQMPKLAVQWQPAGPQAGITLLDDALLGPPLTSWPADERGLPVARLYLPLGREAAKSTQDQAWARLQAPDLDFVLAMLAVMPQALSQAAAGPLPEAATLLSAAEALPHDALRRARRKASWRGLGRAPQDRRRA